jgi:hypothetical protein
VDFAERVGGPTHVKSKRVYSGAVRAHEYRQVVAHLSLVVYILALFGTVIVIIGSFILNLVMKTSP